MAIGTAEPRHDAVSKVTGRSRYTGDFTMPGMRHAVYVRSPHAHALVKAVHTEKALAIQDVEAVFTFKDVAHLPMFATAGHPYSIYEGHADAADRYLLTNHARYEGDEVAIVVARTLLAAKQGAAVVEVEYEILPVVTGVEEALLPTAPLLHPERGTNLLDMHHFGVDPTNQIQPDNPEDLTTVKVRCVAALLKKMPEGSHVETATFHTSRAQHCHLENPITFAYTDDMGHLVLVSSTQIPHIVRRIVGQALDMPWSRVRVIKPTIGGGFGNKQDVLVEPMAGFLAQKLGVPVQIELTREECFQCTRTRHPFTIQGALGLQPNGSLRAIVLYAFSNTGAYASHGHSIALAGGSKMSTLYPNTPYAFAARTMYTNTPAAGAMRGYGSPQVCFALESLLDDAAYALKLDPLAVRLSNTGHPGVLSPLTGKPLYTHGLAECLTLGSQRFDWHNKREEAENFNQNSKDIKRGLGIACFSYGSGTYPANPEPAGARLTLQQDGTFFLICGATEIGQGADTAFAQMAAQTLGVHIDCVRVVSTQDTDFSPFDPGAYASRQTYINGFAIQKAAEIMRHKVLEYASVMTGHHAESLTLADKDIVFARNPETTLLSLHELALDAFYNKDRGCQLFAEAGVKVTDNPPSYGCTFAEIEVDIPLCRIHVKKLLNVHDSGIIINPQLAKGQVQGGMAMGLGYALLEDLTVDEKGHVQNPNLLDYKIPTMADMPDFDVLFVENPEPLSAYGNKSLGEPPLISVAPAVRNALLHATGVAMREIPMDPKHLFKAFKNAGVL